MTVVNTLGSKRWYNNYSTSFDVDRKKVQSAGTNSCSARIDVKLRVDLVMISKDFLLPRMFR